MRLFPTATLAASGAWRARSGPAAAGQPACVSQARLLLDRARAGLARAASRRSQWPLPPLPVSSVIAAQHHPSDGRMMVVPVLSGMAIVGLLLLAVFVVYLLAPRVVLGGRTCGSALIRRSEPAGGEEATSAILSHFVGTMRFSTLPRASEPLLRCGRHERA
jgi:hypothetical protein